MLIVLNRNGDIISRTGRQDIIKNGEEAFK